MHKLLVLGFIIVTTIAIGAFKAQTALADSAKIFAPGQIDCGKGCQPGQAAKIQPLTPTQGFAPGHEKVTGPP